jgi:tetratricopeptide (TPR) repeat protein
MKPTIHSLALAAFALSAAAVPALAQEKAKLPPPSPDASVSQNVLNTKITINYRAPGVKGREIWGKLVPLGEVWRLGANQATTIDFSEAVKVGGKEVPAGKYALFAIPAKDKWTFIINKNAAQWGAFQYKESEDVVRVDAVPSAAPHTEYLNIGIQLTKSSSANVVVRWEKVMVQFPIDANIEALAAKIKESTANAKADDWESYMNAAQFYADNKIDVREASAMIDKSIKIKETWRNYMIKGEILASEKKNAEAIAAYEKSLAIAKDDPETKTFYTMLQDEFKKKINALK